MAKGRRNECKCLSDLPDPILIHIISFLPTKSAVATSLLSRRWQHLWTYTTNLQLHEYLFSRGRGEFMNFVERALLLRGGSSLVSFSLDCSVRNDEYRINTWISSVIRCNVEQLSLFLSRGNDRPSFFLPYCVFSCQSLVKLDLNITGSTNYPGTIRVPSIVCLPHLKHLALKWVAFVDNESTEKLLSHPLLEELIISDCTWGNVTAVNVNSPMLQRLVIDQDQCISREDEDDWSEERQICFIGDNLQFFRYECAFPPTQYCICGSTMQLREAEIMGDMLHQEVQDMDGPSNRYCKLVNSLSMVQTLTLSDAIVHSLYMLDQCSWLQTTLPVFEHVTLLNLHSGDGEGGFSIDSVWLRMLYKRCPHLEHLNFEATIWLDSRLKEDTLILMPMPGCFRTHLKKVTLQSYTPKAEHKDPLFLLFNSAPVLEEVVIHGASYGISDQDEELERKLNAHPKVSENCKVSIVSV